MVHDGKHLSGDRQGDVGDVEEGIGEGARRELVVLVKGTLVEIEAELARVGDHEVGDVRAGVVHSQSVRHRLNKPYEYVRSVQIHLFRKTGHTDL